MPKPCQHPDEHREPGCKVCTLYATDIRYRDRWDGVVRLTLADAPPKKPCGCEDCDCHEPPGT